MFRIGMLVVSAGLAAGQVVLAPVSDRPEIAHEGIYGAVWNGHVLIGLEKNGSSIPILWTLDGLSRKDEVRFALPEAAHITIRDFAGAADGTLAVTGVANPGSSTGWSFVAIIPAGRASNTIIRVDGYSPQLITIAPDGVVWTMGNQTDEKKTWFSVMKRFSPAGKLLTSEALKETAQMNGHSSLKSAQDRVGWLNGGQEFLEFSLDGTVKNRFPGPPVAGKKTAGYFNIALADNLQTIAHSIYERKTWALDRVNKVWKPAQATGETTPSRAFGFDGDQLVTDGYSKDRGFLLVHYAVNGQ